MDSVTWNPDEPLTRMKGERTDANQALHDYALMGPGRSLAKLCDWYKGRQQPAGKTRVNLGGTPPSQPPTKRLRTLEAWSSRYDWQRRVAAWQALQNKRERQKWEERRKEWRERAFTFADSLLDKAETMLQLPVINQYVDTATGQTVVEPAKWTFNTVPQMAAVADKLARLAAEMDTDRRRDLSWRDELIDLIRDGRLTHADVERELGHDLAEELFTAAGVRPGEDG